MTTLDAIRTSQLEDRVVRLAHTAGLEEELTAACDDYSEENGGEVHYWGSDDLGEWAVALRPVEGC